MEKIKVIHYESYRDGGTTAYMDEMNRLYYQWYATKKVYNQRPFPHGSLGMNNIPPPYVQEIKVELEIVDKF